MCLGPEQGTGSHLGLFDILGNGLGCIEVEANGSALVALLVYPDRAFAILLVEVCDFQLAAGRQANTGIGVCLAGGQKSTVSDDFCPPAKQTPITDFDRSLNRIEITNGQSHKFSQTKSCAICQC